MFIWRVDIITPQSSYPRIGLNDIIGRHVGVPGGTRRVQLILVDESGNFGLALQDLDGETFCEMPGNMAVYSPDLFSYN